MGSTVDEHPKSGCRIVHFGLVVSKADRFEVLVNQHQAGRLVWAPWDRSNLSYVGAVQVGEHYVSRVLSKSAGSDETPSFLLYRVGHLNPSGRGRIFTIDDGQQVVESNEGQLYLS